MRAFAVTDPDSPPTVVQLPDPTPGPGEILVRVAASSVNGFDQAVAAGMLKTMMEHRYPIVLGKDFAGTVQEVGAGSSRFARGQRVFGVVTKPYLGDGGIGELLVVGEDFGVTAVPDGVDLPTAGALGLAGSAAADSVDAADLKPGQTVLISGATGGVGSIAVQYATATGATVIVTAKPGTEAEFVRGLGATHTVDYTTDLGEQVRAITPDGVDALIHLAGDPAVLTGLLAEGGRLVSTLGFGPDQHPAAIAIMASPSTATLDRLAADVATGRVRIPISHTYQLDEAPAAFNDFRSGTVAKLGISIT
jgi:NADPH:quinone reductase-like Zn-dependent oxidoreductase